MRVILVQTAASGAIYTRQIMELLLASPSVSEIAFLRSNYAEQVAHHEGVEMVDDPRVKCYAADDMFAPMASGSSRYDAMIVAPCTVGTMSRVAMGVSTSLIERAADVMLKERRRLILMVRETPLSLIHLRNMTTLTEAGAIIMPASPSFYGGESDIKSLCLNLSKRVVTLAGVECGCKEWGS